MVIFNSYSMLNFPEGNATIAQLAPFTTTRVPSFDGRLAWSTRGHLRWLQVGSRLAKNGRLDLHVIRKKMCLYDDIYHQYTPNVSIYTSTMDPSWVRTTTSQDINNGYGFNNKMRFWPAKYGIFTKRQLRSFGENRSKSKHLSNHVLVFFPSFSRMQAHDMPLDRSKPGKG